jgi:hypothetical protein
MGGIVINSLQFVVFSPIWFIAKWFGAPWTIVIERNGTEVRSKVKWLAQFAAVHSGVRRLGCRRNVGPSDHRQAADGNKSAARNERHT